MATADWVDYHSPFNARGDGYQDPSSSSSGPGAGIGAYSWLDLALGSDTGGSVRNPAQVNGAFGNRPTHGIVSLDNVMPLSPDLDTAGLLTRDAVLWRTAAEVLYATNLTFYPSFPKKLYTTGFPKNASTEAEAVLLSFLAELEKFLNTTSSNLPYDAMWANSTLAAQTNAPNLSSLLSLTYGTMISHQQYALLGLPFINDYAAAHSGRRPFLDPPPAVRWQFAANGTTSLVCSPSGEKIIFVLMITGPSTPKPHNLQKLVVHLRHSPRPRNMLRQSPPISRHARKAKL